MGIPAPGFGSNSLLLSLSAALVGGGNRGLIPHVPPPWARGLAGLFWLSRNCKAGTCGDATLRSGFSSENTAEPPPQRAGRGGIQDLPALLQDPPAPLWLCHLSTSQSSGPTQDPQAEPQQVMMAASFSFSACSDSQHHFPNFSAVKGVASPAQASL